MDARSIKPTDARRIGKALQPGLDYLRRLRERMVAVGFLPDDPLFPAVVKAHDAGGELFMVTHYASRTKARKRTQNGTFPFACQVEIDTKILNSAFHLPTHNKYQRLSPCRR